MPRTGVVFYMNEDGTALAYDGLRDLLRQGKKKEFAKCYARIERLEEMGFELHRPEADYLRDGIYELRATHRRVHYRILYFFHGREAAVLSHLITKEGKIPDSEIDRAILHKSKFEADLGKHTLRVSE
jgi:phage-related protein